CAEILRAHVQRERFRVLLVSEGLRSWSWLYIRFLFAYANSDQNGEGCQEVGCAAGSGSRRQSQLPVGRQLAQDRTPRFGIADRKRQRSFWDQLFSGTPHVQFISVSDLVARL